MTTSRLEAFSDGVMAIAITLLTLELRVEDAPSGELWSGVVAAWPHFAAYFVSFLVIGIIWVNHHGLFRFVAVVDRPLLYLNLMLLMFVTLVPFAAALLADHLRDADSHVAAAIYSANGTMIAVSFNFLWRWVVHDDRLVHAHVDLDAARAATRRFSLGLVAYPITVVLSFVNAPLTLAVHFGIVAFYAADQLVRRGISAPEPPSPGVGC